MLKTKLKLHQLILSFFVIVFLQWHKVNILVNITKYEKEISSLAWFTSSLISYFYLDIINKSNQTCKTTATGTDPGSVAVLWAYFCILVLSTHSQHQIYGTKHGLINNCGNGHWNRLCVDVQW